MAKKYWSIAPAPKKPAKLTKDEKIKIEAIVSEEIEKMEKLKNDVARIHIRAGRVYFYSRKEAEEGKAYIVPVVDGKYLEFMYGRITIWDNEFKKCSLDWQRHNDKWIELDKGTLTECIRKMENNDWFCEI
ncbi:MAG: hypothetical protein LBT10_02025 [Methanobrevibacter sp.]|jgi:hypothetical protein|nr:hypothetical protein [Methanobrevibacter sp.]